LPAAMTAKQYRHALRHYGLTQNHAGWLFGGRTKGSGRRWAANGPPFQVALLLDLMFHYGLTPDDIERHGQRYREALAIQYHRARQDDARPVAP
jgi:hypothetical protein